MAFKEITKCAGKGGRPANGTYLTKLGRVTAIFLSGQDFAATGFAGADRVSVLAGDGEDAGAFMLVKNELGNRLTQNGLKSLQRKIFVPSAAARDMRHRERVYFDIEVTTNGVILRPRSSAPQALAAE